MAGTVIVDTINSSVSGTPPVFQANGTQIGTLCRAWVNFDGTGTFSPNPSTTKIRASFNVSSITDNGTGDYTVNFTNAMPDENYVLIGTLNMGGSGVFCGVDSSSATAAPTLKTTTEVRVQNYSGGGTPIDTSENYWAIFR